MKTGLLSSRNLRGGVGVLGFVLTIGLAGAGPDLSALPAELAALVAKHKAAGKALEEQRQAALVHAALPYVASLDSIEKAATTAGQVERIAAIAKECDAIATGSLGPDLPAELPNSLRSSRRALLLAVKGIKADFAKRKEQVIADHLRALAALQAKAASNPEVAKQIDLAKARALKGDDGSADTREQSSQTERGKNAVFNGDFEQLAGESPRAWTSTHNVTVEKEDNNTFIRFVRQLNTDGGTVEKATFSPEFEIPRGTKKVVMSARVRTKDCSGKAPNVPYVMLVFFNPEGTKIGNVYVPWDGVNGGWRKLRGEWPIPKDAGKAQALVYNGRCPGRIDFDDVQAVFD